MSLRTPKYQNVEVFQGEFFPMEGILGDRGLTLPKNDFVPRCESSPIW